MIRRLRFAFLTLLILTSVSFANAQIYLSNTYESPLIVENAGTGIKNLYLYGSNQGNDLESLECSRQYPGVSSYFSFIVPDNGFATVNVEFAEESFFGLAFYLYENDEYIELNCGVFHENTGSMSLKYNDEIDFAGKTILGRLWKLDGNTEGGIGLSITSEEPVIVSNKNNLIIHPNLHTPQQLVQDIFVTGCVEAYNVNYTGHNDAIGYFANGINLIGLTDGIIMSTGRVADAVGPNNSGSTTTNFNTPGDPNLNAIIPQTTQDAAVLTFNFIPASDQLEFRYVFGSEEYPEFAPPNSTSFNDVFAFFISGGPQAYNNYNIALLPGTTTPVSINNVNAVTNSAFYISNWPASINIEYDGFTVPLTAVAAVTQCEVYHLKIAIADVGDGAYDSAVFLEAGSFSAGEGVDITATNNWNPGLPVMQNCSNTLTFCRTDDTNIGQPLYIDYTVGGTAVAGTHYTPAIPTDLMIPAGEMCVSFEFDALITGSNDVTTIILYVDGGCPCDGSDEFVIEIHPPCQISNSISNSGPICVGETADIDLNIDSQYPEHTSVLWSTESTSQTGIQVSPTTTTEYTATVTYVCGEEILSTTVVVNPNPTVSIGPDASICDDQTHVLDAGSGYSYNWSTGANTQTIVVSNPGAYSVTITDSNGCTAASTTNVTVSPSPDSQATNAGPYCEGENATLNASGGTAYEWSGPQSFNSSSQNAIINNALPTHSGEYTVTVTNSFGCTGIATTNLVVDSQVNADINPAGPYCIVDPSENLTAAMTGGTWSGTGITNPSTGAFNPSVAGAGQHTITYNIENGACSDSYDILITVDNNSDPTITPVGTFCITHGTVNLNAATGGGSWTGNGITNGAIGSFNTNTAGVGNHTITYTIINGACTDTDQITIVVDEDVDATITPAGPLCSSDPVINMVAASPGGTWSGTGITNPTNGTFSAVVSGAGNHEITYNVVNGACSDSDQFVVQVDEAVDATITPVGPFCITDSPVVIQAAMTGGTWSGNGITNTTNGDYSPNSAGAGNHTITYEIQNGVCIDTDQITVIVYADVDATITPVGPLCVDNAPVVLSAITNGGLWSGPGVTNNVFNPANAGEGVHTINYNVNNGTCSDNSQTTITVYEIINVSNFMDTTCNDINTEFFVTFDVNNSQGNPAPFLVNGEEFFGSYTGSFESPGPYSITVTDVNNACNEYVYIGYRDCGCATFAGTMESLQLVSLCDGACSDEVDHNGNHVLDGNDVYEFILHEGSGFPVTPLAINDTPTFCFYDIPGLQLGQIYYISAIAGDELAGHVDVTDNCYSQSQGTPVAWYESPSAFINHGNKETCGLEIDLSAEAATPGLFGAWTANAPFYTINGTSVYDPDISVIVQESGVVEFTWSVHDGPCYGSASVDVTFNPTPVAYAGENFSVCGLVADLEAVLSLPGESSGQWSGPGLFSPSSAPDAQVTVDAYGQYTFTWEESVGSCSTADQVTVNFITEPNPSIVNPNDTVCGIEHVLFVNNVNGTGSWTAYVDGEVLVPAPTYQQGAQSPYTSVTIGNYQGLFREVEFVWTEQVQVQGVQCFGTASQTVVFSRKPIASVGPIDEDEICGDCVTFNADTTGSGWANGRWVSPTSIIHTFLDNPYMPDASLCINPLGSYGDSAHVRAPFLWVMNNYGCSSVDTMWVTFYRQPDANAGLDDAICGNNYHLGAVYDLPHSASYVPQGIWSVHERPDPAASANIVPFNNDSAYVSVSHYGQWVFQFRENNSLATFCYSTDTVRIEFVEVPVVDAGEDKHICGPCTEMEAVSAGFSGNWLHNGAQFADNDFSDPNASVCINNYGPRDFIWMESNIAETQSLSCTSVDTVEITFWRVPQPLILTDAEDSTTCGLTFDNLRAQNPGSGINGVWWNETDPDAVYGDPNHHNTNVTVTTYGYHDFYWIASTGPTFMPGFCNDTAGPLRIHFIEIPTADAGEDMLFCGYQGELSAIPSIGTGVWSTPSSELVDFDDINDPNTIIYSEILNTGNASHPYFNLIWTEDNTNGCTDRDTIKIVFARIPNSGFDIVPPRCFGEPATFSAQEDSLQQYQWNFYTGIIDSTVNNVHHDANYQHFVYWTNEDTSHRVTLIVTNHWGCQSAITIDTVYEPMIPDFNITIVHDTCQLGKGAIMIQEDMSLNAFYWQHETIGPRPWASVDSVYDLPAGVYELNVSYRTINQAWYNYYINVFGSARCSDMIDFEILPIGMLEAQFVVDASIEIGSLVVPEATVIFNNQSDYDGIRRRCVWHFGDGNTLTSCDDQVEHVYTESDCYEPFLIIMNRDLQECRDTAYLDFCINVDKQSEIEVPNAFSPNGDGINDFFQVKAQTLSEYQGYVVNRWGNVIYEWTNWQDEEAGWDGKLSGGIKASTGVYFYIIKAKGMDDEEYNLYGSFHLFSK